MKTLFLPVTMGASLFLAFPMWAQDAPLNEAATATALVRGQVRASWESGMGKGYYSTAQPTVANLSGDGKLAIVLPGLLKSGEAAVAAWSSDGTPMTGFPLLIQRKGLAQIGRLGLPSVADLDNSGRDQILVSATGEGEPTNDGRTEQRFVFICGANGDEWPVNLDAPVDPSTGVTPIVDIDDDGVFDIVSGSVLTSVLGPTRPVKNWPLSEMPRGYSPAIGDATGDGELMVYQPEQEKYWFKPGHPEAHVLSGWDRTGKALPGWPQKIENIVFNPSIGDVTGDGKMEVCVANGPYIHLWTWDGKPLPSTHAVGEFTSVFKDSAQSVVGNRILPYTCTVLADLDGDNKAEILALDGMGALYAWHADGTGVRAPDGLLFRAPNSQKTNQAFVDLISSPGEPVVADLGDDGETDIVVGSRWFTLKKDGSLVETDMAKGPGYAPSIVDLEGDGRAQIVFLDGDKVVVYEAGLSFPNKGAQWPTTRGNLRRTGAWVAPDKR